MLSHLPGPVRAGLAPLGGALLALGFLTGPGPVLALVALGMLIGLWITAEPGRAALEGLVAGLVFYGVLLRWFAAAILDHSDLPAWLAAAAVIASAVVLALGTALIGATTSRVARRAGLGAALIAAPVLWFGHELLRGIFPLPFPWGVLSAAAAGSSPAVAAARTVGSHGVSFGIALGAATLAALLLAPRRGWPAPIVWGVLVTGLALVEPPLGERETLTIGVVQGSLPREAHPLEKLDTYSRLTAEAAAKGAEIVVWPESAVPYRLDSHPGYRRRVERLARRIDVDLLVGTLSEAPGGGGLRNSVALVRARGGTASVSSKRQLVPFGEYLPLGWLFSNARALAAEAGDFVPGERVVLHPVEGQRVACLICYEAVFPELAADAVDAGAGLLVNITNDSWFGWTSGPRQHLMHSVLRAAETGRPLARAANSGISVIVGGDGTPRGRLRLGAQGVLTAAVAAGGEPAPGYVVGRWLARGCATLSLVVLGGAWLPIRRGPRVSRARDPDPRDDTTRTDADTYGQADA